MTYKPSDDDAEDAAPGPYAIVPLEAAPAEAPSVLQQKPSKLKKTQAEIEMEWKIQEAATQVQMLADMMQTKLQSLAEQKQKEHPKKQPKAHFKPQSPSPSGPAAVAEPRYGSEPQLFSTSKPGGAAASGAAASGAARKDTRAVLSSKEAPAAHSLLGPSQGKTKRELMDDDALSMANLEEHINQSKPSKLTIARAKAAIASSARLID